MLRKFIGDRAFYSTLIKLTLPIMIQNGITNFVSMLDNIMIGSVGTAPMTGVAIANQLLFVFNLCIFGAVSGAGIFGAQYFGRGDYEGVRHAFRFKLLFCGALTIVGLGLFTFFGEELLMLYMRGETGLTDAAATLASAKSYLAIMVIGIIPFAIVQCYSGTLREGAQPNLPMLAGVAAVLVNLLFNYILIFGKFGAPAMGVRGAAIATVLSRFVELAIVTVASHSNSAKYPYIKGLYRTLLVPRQLAAKFFIKGLPLLLNETLWAAGMAFINQSYSLRGLDAVAAVNISQTFWNVFSVAFMALGFAVGIVMGQMLGAGKLDEARESAPKMMAFSFSVSTVFAIIYFICAALIPYVYNTEPEIRSLATNLMRITAICMPLESLTHASYFIIRSGGRMLVTFFFDSGYVWCISGALAYVLAHFTAVPFISIFLIIQICSAVKFSIGILLVRNGFWVRNIVAPEN